MYLFSVYVCGDGESGVLDYECVSVQGWVGGGGGGGVVVVEEDDGKGGGGGFV